MAEPGPRGDDQLQDSARRARMREQFLVPANAILAYSQVLHDAALRDGRAQASQDWRGSWPVRARSRSS